MKNDDMRLARRADKPTLRESVAKIATPHACMVTPYFQSKQKILIQFPRKQHKGRGKHRRHVFVDNGAPVLLVAHIDTVQAPRYDAPYSGAGFDDRLGVYVGHQLAQTYPHWFDLLLTDYEESFASTAKYFVPTHRYNWIAELDREGEDFVDYGLASSQMIAALESYGFMHGFGSYSDICELRFLRVSKINVGLGTYNGHSAHSGYRPDVLERQLCRLLAFTRDYADTMFPHRPPRLWYLRESRANSE